MRIAGGGSVNTGTLGIILSAEKAARHCRSVLQSVSFLRPALAAAALSRATCSVGELAIDFIR